MPETPPHAFLRDERFINEHRKVFVMFMGRDGYSEEMSTEEFPRLQKTVKLDACPLAYLRLQRTGSRFALDRRKKGRLQKSTIKQGNMRITATALRLASSQSDWTLPLIALPISCGGLFKLKAETYRPPLGGVAVTTRLMEILDRDAAVMRAKMAEVMPAADGEVRQARELMILLHTGLFVIQRDEGSTAEELREFAGQILDRTRITRQ
ncbi:hypothetical protein [Microvirga yunnanensis]|uniref:hypothetical protein n=1 Tax=Microvirga yunnanensis TaxID=2953740 RepID=UPI0021C97E7A|nr:MULTISPECIES: hypothetical protein [unclassified Microvirga]